MDRSSRAIALEIWNAALDAVRADQLVESHVSFAAEQLNIGNSSIQQADIDRLIIVGAGKATGSMADGLLRSLPADFTDRTTIEGWINVPENCVIDLSPITVHGARPVGVNEPTEAAVIGSQQILRLVNEAGPRDICICLISGGGSALLTCPIKGVSLEEKVQLIRFMTENGANIEQLNSVRKQLSRVKGGALAREFHGQRMFSLIISDVIGDPLDVIASGPTVENQSDATHALSILSEFDPDRSLISTNIYSALEQRSQTNECTFPLHIENHLIGNLQIAVDAAGEKAKQLGFEVQSSVASELEGGAEDVGRSLARQLIENRQKSVCIISGGEPTVKLAPLATRGKGGRNQQLALAAMSEMSGLHDSEQFCILSGGTDGEDGPTDAAGALIDSSVIEIARKKNLDPLSFLARNDAYHFFEQTGGLIKTGATQTNVCDVRIALKWSSDS